MRVLGIFSVFVFLTCCTSNREEPRVTEELMPDYLIKTADLPAFEQQLDHAHFINAWSREFYHKGMITYRTVCFTCHGNEDQMGSIPNSTRFWKDTFKFGSDPYSMYQTITRGAGLMAPQVHLSPREKYEVIHFIREEYLRENNASQYAEVDSVYLASLPQGDSIGPPPKEYRPWAEMDYGNFLIQTYELADDGDPPRTISRGRSPLANEDYRHVNFAYKGIAIRLDKGAGGIAAGNAFVLFDHDLMRFTGFWTGEGFIDYRSILLNDEHNIYPRTVGEVQIANSIMPGWANPETGDFKDPRFVAVDGRPFGPLPRSWAQYKGLYYHGDKVIIKYRVGDADVLETYALEQPGVDPVISRTLNINNATTELKLFVSEYPARITSSEGTPKIAQVDSKKVVIIPANKSSKIKIYYSKRESGLAGMDTSDPENLEKYTQGGPAHDIDQTLTSAIIRGDDQGAYAVDVYTLPHPNPWKSRLRPTGIDFLNGGKDAVLCTIDGEVWRVSGIAQDEGMVKWNRIATGLFQPLGIKVRDGEIYVGCRDQIVVLRDLNEDGETDFYECFNSDHQVTEHFHEFAMGLQTDENGNFYYAKSGRHARTSLVPQHGTLIKVSKDGHHSEILANGFRAANGVCMNPDGSYYVTDQEGFWNPMNRINRVTYGGFYGNMYGYNPPIDSSDQAMVPPLIWVDKKYDRSPAELLWVDSRKWGPLNGKLLNLSYGNGKIFVVMTQEVNENQQGAMIELPIPKFPTGIMRARFNPLDGQFYGCGMSAWATNQMIQVGGFYRVRYTGNPLNMVLDMTAQKSGLKLVFSDPLDSDSATNLKNYQVSSWGLKRTRKYGSDRYNEKILTIDNLTLSRDLKYVFIHLPDIEPVWIIEVLYDLESQQGVQFQGAIQGTIYDLEDTLF